MGAGVFELNEESLAVVEELGGHMPGGFFIYQAEQPEKLLYANKPVFDIFGCDGPEDFRQLTGYTFRGMVYPEDYPGISDSIARQIRESSEQMDYTEYRIVRKDGAVRWVDDYGHYLETDRYGGIFTVFISDITEKHERIASDLASRQATIDALNDSFRKAHAERITFSRIAQALAGDFVCLYVVDPDTEDFVEYSSSREYAALQIEKAGSGFFSLSRKNMERLIYPEDRDRFMAVFTKEKVLAILKRDGTFTTKYRLMLGGEPVFISMKATLLEDEDGSHLIVGANNIDAQMKREQAFQTRIAEARNRAKNEFLANMSHDIRTPMNAIVGYTHIAANHLEDPDVVRDSLEKIGSSSHYMLSLINDLLDISRMENGQVQLNIGLCDLAAVLRRIEDITWLQAQQKHLTITYQRESVRHFQVLGDEQRLEQILINIVNNAIKYTPEHKSVDLIAEEYASPEEEKRRYRFVIRDTGTGIGEDYLPHIFDSFTREMNTTVNSVRGTGLGLAISAKLVKQMGGTITVKSEVGKGSEFTVEVDLPLWEPEEQKDPAAEQADLNGRRVLLVEDNEINADIAMMVLEEYGVNMDWAIHGQAGLEKIQQMGEGYYDAVLMDIQMPVMNGYEAARAIRGLKGAYYQSIPIIAISANDSADDVRACLEAGMNAHIGKPYEPETLMTQLYLHIEKDGTKR